MDPGGGHITSLGPCGHEPWDARSPRTWRAAGEFQPCDTVAPDFGPRTGQNDPKPQLLVFAAATPGDSDLR